MTENSAATETEPGAMLAAIRPLEQRCAWEAIAAFAEEFPVPFDEAWVDVADALAFAFGQLSQWGVAIGLLERAFELVPTWRRASSLAYQYYDASLALVLARGEKPELDREALRKGFRQWIGKALELRPDSIKDLYRLGVFEAQVEARHDTQALRAFVRVVELYGQMPAGERERRGDLRKTCTKALYAGGRSALRLGRVKLARKLSFACIREDEGKDHVAPVHKLHLAAKVCVATGELDHAERAARLALDGKGPPRRDYVFGLLSDIALARGDARGACAWVEQHVPEPRRSAALWRKLGDARLAGGDREGACGAWESALRHDRCGRHLTLVRLGRAYMEAEQLGKAEDAFRKAAQFRTSRYMKEDQDALRGLEEVLKARGKTEELPRVQARLAKCGAGAAEREDREEGEAVA